MNNKPLSFLPDLWDLRSGLLYYMAVAIAALTGSRTALSQGTVTFDASAYWSGTNYVESGIRMGLVVPTYGSGSPSHDGMAIGPAITTPSNIPYNATPYMVFFRQFSPDNYVTLGLTSGSVLGLISVDLADPSSPSFSLLPITFIGFRADGSTVSQTFTTPGGGANSFLTYQFGPDFASGLLSVQIDASRWAMDNLVWVPEPSTYALLGLGLLALAWQRFQKRRRKL